MMSTTGTGARPDSPAREIVHEAVATVHPEASLREVAETLTGQDVGLVLVAPIRDAVGVISERDLVTVLAGGGDVDGRLARDVMTTDLVQVGPDTTVAEIAGVMDQAGVRHVLVRDGEHLLGLVSVRDLLPVLAAGARG